MVVQKDIALRLGISRTAVSAILSGGPSAEKFRPEMRCLVEKTAEELGYQHNQLAQAIRRGRNNVIGFITQRLRNGYAGSFLEGVVEQTSQNDFSVKIIPIERDRDASQLAKHCIGQCLAGVLIYDIAEREFLSRLHERLEKHNIPLFLAGSSPDIGSGLYISSDTIQGGRIAFDYLYSLGHRVFALPADYSDSMYSNGLFEGFSNTAREAGVSLGDQAPWRSSEYANIDLLCAALIEKKITACFCNTDFLALKVIMKLQRIGVRVPEDISVMGRGNLSFCASSHPKITTLDENLFGIGKRATTLLLDIIEHGNTVIREEFFPHQLIIRDSTLSAFAEKGKVT